MLKLDNIGIFNAEGAFRGMRNPLESWDKSDNGGPNDLALAKKLVAAGTDHSKFMRQIFVSMDITAPMSWWWDFDTYKVATVRNSTSRMHKLGSRLLTPGDFSWDDEDGNPQVTWARLSYLEDINESISRWQHNKDKNLWRSIVMDLPASYNFLSTWTGNYQVLRNVYHARKDHKQREFREFCAAIAKFPHGELITM